MLDEKDRKILQALQEDAGRPVRTLARILELPRTTVQHRIKRMRQTGIIQRTVVVPNYESIGLPLTAIILVTYAPITGTSQHDVAQAITQLSNVTEVHIVAGSWDIILKARGASLKEIGDLVVNKLRQMPGVGQTVTCGCFFTLKEEP